MSKIDWQAHLNTLSDSLRGEIRNVKALDAIIGTLENFRELTISASDDTEVSSPSAQQFLKYLPLVGTSDFRVEILDGNVHLIRFLGNNVRQGIVFTGDNIYFKNSRRRGVQYMPFSMGQVHIRLDADIQEIERIIIW